MGTARPGAARIDDFASPRFSPEVDAIREAVEPMAAQLHLEPEPLLARAVADTGLDDFGADARFGERLEVWLTAMRAEAGLSSFGVVSTHTLTRQLLVNRLRIQQLVASHPEILDIPVARPIVIAGLPRTGTTHLHNLLSADPNLRSLPYWESLEPVPVPGEEPDGRVARTQFAVDLIDAAMPLFKRMHEMTVDHVHEEIQLLAIDFSSMLMETVALAPSWRDYYRAHDQTPHYRYLKLVLQVLSHLRGGERWVLKSPQHTEQLRALADVFPDATFVVTHRDPVVVTASTATLVTYGARMNAAAPDPHRYGAYWSARVEDLLMGCLRDHDELPQAQTVDVLFHEYMADDVATVERIYDVAGQPFTGETRAAMTAFVAEHPRGRHGTIVYDLADFGIDAEERRGALRPYAQRFGVRPEL